MKQQTAIEFLFEKLWEAPKDKFTWNSILKYAKEIEKQKHASTWDSALLAMEERVNNFMMARSDFDKYYKETYENK